MVLSILTVAGEPDYLRKYIRYSLENNPEIQSMYSNWQAQIDQIAISKGLPNPSLSFGYFLKNIETAVGPQEYKIGISQMIPWFGKLKLQGDIQAQLAEISRYTLEQRRNEIQMEVTQLYYEYYYLTQSFRITLQNLDLIQQWQNLIRTAYSSGRQSYSDLINVQIELKQVKEDLASLINKRKVLFGKFQSLLNNPGLDTIKLPDSLTVNIQIYRPEDMEILIKKNNPDYQAAQINVSLSERIIARKKLNFYPDFMIGTDYIFTGDKYVNGSKVKGSGKDPLAVNVSLSIPVWLKKEKAGLQSAKNNKQSNIANLQNLANRFRARLIEVVNQIDDSRRKIQFYRDELIPDSIELLKTSESAYITGKMDIQSLIDAQRKHLHFQMEYEHSVSMYYQSLAELEMLTGGSL